MDFVFEVIAYLLDKVNDQKEVRNFLRNLGAMIREEVPGDNIEPELAEALELIIEGILDENSDEI